MAKNRNSFPVSAQQLVCDSVWLYCPFSLKPRKECGSVSLHPLPMPEMLGKGTVCRLTARGYWADGTTPLQLLFVQICHIPTISGCPSICPSIGKFFLSCKDQRKTPVPSTQSLTLFSCIHSSCGSSFHFEVGVDPEVPVLFSFCFPSL